MTMISRSILAGAVFVALGLIFAIASLRLDLGTAFRMGPGYFPLVLAGLLTVIGIAVIVQALGRRDGGVSNIPWRGLALILAAPIVFGLTVRGVGLVPAIIAVVLISAFASRRMRAPLALALTVGLTAFCVLVFNVGLGLPIRLIGPWADALGLGL
jgi:hypothetical protein